MKEYPIFIMNAILTFTLFMYLRLFPLWKTRNQGCDAYYFLFCAEQLKKKFKLPIKLPAYYLLEGEEQWYPPLFSVFLSLIPEPWLKQYHWLINQCIDYLNIFVAFCLVSYLYHPWLGSLIVIMYALQTPLIMEFRGLSSRPLGLVFTTLFICSVYYANIAPSIFSMMMVVTLGVLIIYTHKLSVQLLWFLMPFLSLVYQDLSWMLGLVLSYFAAFIIWPSLFIKIIRAHLDIMLFWAKNWNLLGAHPVKQSPIYGDHKTRIHYFKEQGSAHFIHIFRTLIHMNYWIVFLPLALMQYAFLNFFEQYLLWVVVGIYSWSLLTWLIPKLRFVGLGQQYVKYAYVPNLMLAASLFWNFNVIYSIAALLCLALSIRQYYMVAKEMRLAQITQIGHLDEDFSQMIEHIKNLNEPRLMCLPYHFADILAYASRKPVLWGAHGYGFKQLSLICPIIREPIINIAKQYALTHLLIKRNYCEIDIFGFTKEDIEHETNDYILVTLKKYSQWFTR